MKKDLKTSTLAIICVLCTAAVSGAYGAASVRSLGGSGTYTSASSAAASNDSGAASVRGGSVRVNPTSGVSGTSATVSAGTTTSGRVATTPRLSIGHYLGGGTSISGGSSLRPQTPGASTGGTSSGGGSMDPDVAAGLRQEVDQLRRDVDELGSVNDNINDAIDDLSQGKQDALVPVVGGYIIIDSNNEIFVDVDALAQEIGEVAGQDGREVVLGYDDDNLLWRYDDESSWEVLIPKSEITGPQGPQGEKGEPGEAANLDAYSTTEQMNAAIDKAIADLAGVYATTEYVDTELSAKADKATTLAGYGIRDAMTEGEINKAIEDATKDIVGSEEIEQFKGDVAGLKTTVGDENSGLVKDVNDLSGAVTALDGEMDTVSQLAGRAASTATGAAESAAQALSGLVDKEDKANKKTTLTNSDTDYPSTSAVTAALADYVKTDALPGEIGTALENAGAVTDENISEKLSGYATDEDLAAKADASDVEALGQRVDAAETNIEDINTTIGSGELATTDKTVLGAINELKSKTDGMATDGNFEEMNEKITAMESQLEGKQDVSNLVQVVSEADTTKYPSGAAVYKELETKANASDLDNYVTNDGLATAVDGVLDTAGVVTEESLATKGFVTETELDEKDYVTNLDLTAKGYATTTDLDAKQDKNVGADKNGQILTVGADGNITTSATIEQSAVNGLTDALDAKADKAALDNYVTNDGLATAVDGALDTAGVVTDENLAEKLDGYATDEELAAKADASDVAELETAVGALETTVGDGESGLVKDVADAKAAADKASQDVAGKQDALTAEQLNAVNSGITAEKVSVYDGYADDIADKQDALGYTAEDVANKTDDMATDTGSTTKYPTVHAVEAYVASQVAEGVEINTDQIAAGAVKTDQIGNGAVTEEKLSDELNAEIDGKEDKANLKALAYKDQIKDADVADDAAIAKSKLALDVQTALDNAANAVAAPAGEKASNSVLGTDGDGNPVWYEIAM